MELRTILIRSPRNSWDAAFLLVCADRDNDLNWIGYAMFRFHKHATCTHETQTTKSNIFTSFSYCQNQLRKVPDNTASTRFRQLVKRSMWNFEITKYPPNIYDFLLIIRIWDLIHDKIREFFSSNIIISFVVRCHCSHLQIITLIKNAPILYTLLIFIMVTFTLIFIRMLSIF